MTRLRIRGGHVLSPDMTVAPGDVVVDDESGEIVAVGDDVPTGDETLDATDCLVMPGLVNAHAHVAMTLLRGYADDKPLDTWLREDVWPIESELTPADVRAGAELGILEMIKTGTTAFCDMYFHVPEIAAAVESAGIRALLGHGIVTVGKDEADARADVEESLAVAREWNGAADGRIATAFMPHGLTTVGESYLRETVEEVRAARVPIHYHANETVDDVEPIVEAHGVRPLEYARDVGLLENGDLLAHCVHVDDREIELLAETGAAAVHCPASNMKLASGMAPVQRLLDAGVTVALGTDGPASNNDLDCFDELRDAAMLGKLAADDASAVPAAAAVRMATEGGAAALGIDAGRVEPGAKADLAVIDLTAPHLQPPHDLVSHLAYAVTGADVRHTICDGRVLMADREVLTLDERRVCETANERAAALVDRVS